MLTSWAITYLPKLLFAIAVLLAGLWLIKKAKRLAESSLRRADMNQEIISFLLSLVDIALKVFLLITVAGMIGIETASIIGIVAAAGFAVGLALQGSLGNFAAGIIIIVFKPYKVGDWIEVQDKFGKVEEIQIFNTHLVTPGMKTLIIPNGKVIDGVVTNFSKKGHIRLELHVTMAYEESFPKISEILQKVMANHPKVLTSPAPEVSISKFDAHNVVISVRPYVDPDDYWEVTYALHQAIKAAFYEHNIKVAIPDGVELSTVGE